MNKAEKSLRWMVNQIPDFKPTTNEEKMLLAIKLYSEAGAEEIKRLKAENAELKATISKMETVEKELRDRLKKTVELPCKVGDKLFVVMPELYGNQIIEALVNQIIFNHGETKILVYYDIHQEGRIHELYESFLGKTVFLTRESAKKATCGTERG